MYIKVNNGAIEKYPYSIDLLKKDNSQTSFPDIIPETILAEWNVFSVEQMQFPNFNQYTENVREDIPQFIDGKWKQIWIVEPATPEQIEERTNELKSSIRGERNQKLQESDWVVAYSLEKGQSVPQQWQDYRQALRDITAQENFPFSVEWPISP